MQLKNEWGSIINPDFAKRDQVLAYCCKMIPQLKSRIANPRGITDVPVPVASSSQPAQNNKKTKGKGKR